jgi:hypothetical protein
MYTYPVTIGAVDEYNNAISTNFYVDGVNRGGSGTYSVYSGTHSLGFEQCIATGGGYGYTFSYFQIGSTLYYGNPSDVNVSSSMTVTAHYTYGLMPNYWVTVNLVDDGTNWPVYGADVFVNSEYVGTCGWEGVVYFQAQFGSQVDISVSDPVPIPGYYGMYWFFNHFEGGTGGNPTTVTVSYQTTITAHYQNGYARGMGGMRWIPI